MPPAPFVVMELFVFALAAVLTVHAYRRGTRWLSTYIWSMAFGLAIELLIVTQADVMGQHYRYGQFLWMAGVNEHQVPVWVGVGWGVVVYISTFTAQRLRSRWWVRPLSAGVLAVNLDLSLDPVAAHLGFWTWINVPELNLYGVPFDNFLGWWLIVSSFALCTRGGFRWIPASAPLREWWIPGLAGALSLALAYGVGAAIDGVYEAVGDFVVFVFLFGLTGTAMFFLALDSKRDNPKDLYVLGGAMAIHGLLLVLFFATGTYEALPSLAVFIPLSMLLGFFAFSWFSIDSMFPQAHHRVARTDAAGK